MDSHEYTVVLGTDQLIEGGGHGFGQVAVAEQGDIVADHDGAKAHLRRSPNQDAIAGKQLDRGGGEYKNGLVALLHEQEIVMARKVCNRSLKGGGQRLVGLGIAEGGNLAQRGQCGGRGCPGSRGPAENDRDHGNQSLRHCEYALNQQFSLRFLKLYRQYAPKGSPWRKKISCPALQRAGSMPGSLRLGACRSEEH